MTAASRTAGPAAQAARLAAEVADRAVRLGWSVGTAESLTSGSVAAALGAAPSASTWFRGSVVAYASEVKFDLLEVPEGPVVSSGAALTMAKAAAALLSADLVVAVTGAGGPDPQDGQPPGTVWFGVVWPHGKSVEERFFDGPPERVVAEATAHALQIACRALRPPRDERPAPT